MQAKYAEHIAAKEALLAAKAAQEAALKADADDRYLKIYVKTMTGKATTIHLRPDFTIHQLKLLFQEKEGVVPDQQRFFFKGKQLDDARTHYVRTLSDYNIKQEDTLDFVLRLTGGGVPFNALGRYLNLDQSDQDVLKKKPWIKTNIDGSCLSVLPVKDVPDNFKRFCTGWLQPDQLPTSKEACDVVREYTRDEGGLYRKVNLA